MNTFRNIALTLLAVAAVAGNATTLRPLAQDPNRPQLHLTASAGWINDPNGLSYYNGEWHAFCQHNPFGVQWAAMHWNHFVSKDLLHWEDLGDVLCPDQLGMMFSGCAVVDSEGVAGFGKGAQVLIYTASAPKDVNCQCIASSMDGRNYVKFSGNPIIKKRAIGDRDPKVLWHRPSNRWVMVLYGEENNRHVVWFFTSSDLKDWQYASTFVGDEKGKGKFLYECPGFEELPIEGESGTAWVLWGANGDYVIGTFDGTTFRQQGQRQHGMSKEYYAAQTFSGVPDGRCIWTAWLRMPYRTNSVFHHAFSIFQELSLKRTADGLKIARRPIREMKKLRVGESVPFERFDGELAEISISCKIASDGLLACDLRGLKLAYDAAAAKLTLGDKVVDWPIANGEFAVTVYLDRHCAEVFSADGLKTEVAVSGPSESGNRKLSVLSAKGVSASKFQAWRLNGIW